MRPTIRKPTEAERQQATAWPIWEKERSTFPWQYDSTETCLILAGDVTVTNEDGEVFTFGVGDYVIFPCGMKCTWNIRKDVRKHYSFD